jgi:hypothetical protein
MRKPGDRSCCNRARRSINKPNFANNRKQSGTHSVFLILPKYLRRRFAHFWDLDSGIKKEPDSGSFFCDFNSALGLLDFVADFEPDSSQGVIGELRPCCAAGFCGRIAVSARGYAAGKGEIAKAVNGT